VIGQIYGQSKKNPDIGDLFLNAGTELTSNPASLLEWPNFPSYVPGSIRSQSHYGRLILLEARVIRCCHPPSHVATCAEIGAANMEQTGFYCCLILHFPFAKLRFTSRLPGRFLHCLFSVMWGPNAVIQSPNLHWSAGYPTACQLVDCQDGFLLGNFRTFSPSEPNSWDSLELQDIQIYSHSKYAQLEAPIWLVPELFI